MSEDHIKRHANGSMDLGFYMAKGRVCRSQAFYAAPGYLRDAFRRLLRRTPATSRPVQSRKSLGDPITT